MSCYHSTSTTCLAVENEFHGLQEG
ncbi:hypothetical protein NPIL_243051, partial [Nephila pilipes]